MNAIVPAAAALAILFTACGGTAATDDPQGRPSSTTSASSATLLEGPSALDDPSHPGFPEPLVDTDAIISGGPPPDGIPPIDAPEFVTIEVADGWLQDAEPVVVLEVEDEARAYPVQILIWHEIVNDTIGGVPVSVTYCPLCNSAVSYRRTIDGVETTFGTSGRLFASALVMYDRATESLWTHFDGRAIVGVLTGHELEPIPSPLLAEVDQGFPQPPKQVGGRGDGDHRSAGCWARCSSASLLSAFLATSWERESRASSRSRAIAASGSSGREKSQSA